jgi:ubiquinone biosynthesis protein UbiJ
MVRAMAQGKGQKDLLTRLSDAGEEALSRVAGSPATTRLVETVGGMRDRLDEVQKKVRGLDALERRVAKLEERVDELSKPKRSAASTRSRASTTKRTTPPKKPST